MKNMKSIEITIRGMVQGIGFRPFVAELAEQLHIGGWVRNSNGIVTVCASADPDILDEFVKRLQSEAPAGSVITGIEVKSGDLQNHPPIQKEKAASVFRIIHSNTLEAEQQTPLIPADLPTCDRCKAELHDPENRRFRHPFISCTACGPRYSILDAIPYDRDTIVMKDFPMCPDCAKEYTEKGNVRRHAQTICCPDCGPVLAFTSFAGISGEGIPKESISAVSTSENCIPLAADCLKAGGIVAVKDIGGYHLAASPFEDDTVTLLRQMKHREKKPFAVMFADEKQAAEYCEINEEEKKLLLSSPRPIVLLKRKMYPEQDQPENIYGTLMSEAGVTESASPDAQVTGIPKAAATAPAVLQAPTCNRRPLAADVCGSSPDVGAMLPCNPVQIMLTELCGPLIMTSANTSGDLLTLENEAMEKWLRQAIAGAAEEYKDQPEMLKKLAHTGMLGHNRPIRTPLDDSILRIVRGKVQTFRRARGFVPDPIPFQTENSEKGNSPRIFAAGGDLKSVFAYVQDGKAYVSQHLGDLEEVSSLTRYGIERTRMQQLFGFTPDTYVCDLHPGYHSSRMLKEGLAKEETDSRFLTVQHHQAHVASVMAEHALKGPVLGFAFDGTGYGTDGTIWGSEVFLWNPHDENRADENQICEKQADENQADENQTDENQADENQADENQISEKKSVGKQAAGTMQRVSHLKPVFLTGGDEGARNCDTILYGYLHSFSKETQKELTGILSAIPENGFQRSHYELTGMALKMKINCIASSSMGRLFDAVSAFLGICHYNSYEGEAPVELENLAVRAQKAAELPVALEEVQIPESCETGPAHTEILWNTENLFLAMGRALQEHRSPAEIARGFLMAAADYILKISCMYAKPGFGECNSVLFPRSKGSETAKPLQIVLSGGTFLNRILLEKVTDSLETEGIPMYRNELVPPGDGGICLGQAWLAMHTV